MHRLRDLTRRQRVLGALLVLLVLVPVGASLGRAVHQQWIPSGDDALIGLRSYDALTSHRPLVGQPSTSHLYGPEEGTAHPGPIEFYWLAVPLRLLGPAVGMTVGIAVVSTASLLVAAWVVLRRAGPGLAAWSLVLLGALLWSQGTAVLTDPISSNAGGIPLIALAALAWAVVDGDHRLLPLAALFGSWVAQQHLAIVAPAAGLVGWAVVGTAVGLGTRWWRHRSAAASDPPPTASEPAVEVDDPVWIDDDAPVVAPLAPSLDATAPAAPAVVWPWVVAAAVVGLVLWSPVIYQQLTGHPGNVTAVLEYAQTSETPKLGWTAGFRQSLRAVGAHPFLLREDLTGFPLHTGPLSIADAVAGIATYVVLAATAVLAWRRRRPLALLAGTALVLALFGAYNGSTIPDSIEANRINFYRWMYVVAWLSWLVLGWLALLGAQALLARQAAAAGDRADADDTRPAWTHRLVPALSALAVVALLVPAVATVTTAGYNDRRRDQTGFWAMRDVGAAAVAEAEGHHRVTVVLRGVSAGLASGPALTLALTAAGHEVVVFGQEARFYGDQRILEPGDDPGTLILELVTWRGPRPEGPGRVIARVDMNPDNRDLLGPLVARAVATPPVLAPDAEEILSGYGTPAERDYLRQLLTGINTNPEQVLTQETLRAIVADGYFTEPAFTAAEIASLDDLVPSSVVNDNDQFELRVLTRDELAQVEPRWAESP